MKNKIQCTGVLAKNSGNISLEIHYVYIGLSDVGIDKPYCLEGLALGYK